MSVWQLQTVLADVRQSCTKEPALPKPTCAATDNEVEESLDIVQLLDVYNSPDTLFLVMRAEMGGDLAARLASMPGCVLPEAEARMHATSLLRALAATHAQGIVHRDIKASNVLLSQEGVARLGDFGLAASIPESDPSGTPPLLTAVVGTHDNMAPEMVRSGHGETAGYDTSADMWQCGLLLFEMMFGKHPFSQRTQIETLVAVISGQFSFPEATVSEPARDLVRRLLVTDPRERLTAPQCLSHPWIERASIR